MKYMTYISQYLKKAVSRVKTSFQYLLINPTTRVGYIDKEVQQKKVSEHLKAFVLSCDCVCVCVCVRYSSEKRSACGIHSCLIWVSYITIMCKWL